ncbi:hypothetical protein [Microcoleus sp. Pol12A6]|uniref:hypothetical protein n=1 Tax=Microcoleus sp. Pol12A6 TaxID=3055393 RepID=UPI002FD1CCFD
MLARAVARLDLLLPNYVILSLRILSVRSQALPKQSRGIAKYPHLFVLWSQSQTSNLKSQID